ncbi:MAG: hypothetical protein IKU22_00335 [Alistipes sp.]|nr:hypothetical protein [Alistipes sp.]
MIKIKNERDLLPIIRSPFANWSATQENLFPLVLNFIESGFDEEEYCGWAFSMKMYKNTSKKHNKIVESINFDKLICKYDWEFAPSLINKNETILKNDSVLIVFHQESWLWFA